MNITQFYIAYIGLLGLIIGSFLNVCIYRIPRRFSLSSPIRSYCPNCEVTLRTRDNIPVLSWLFLGGKCFNCKERIPFRYPFVEILSGFAALECYLAFGLTWTALVIYALVAALITITFIDLDFKIIPNLITYPGIHCGLLLGLISENTQAFAWPVTQSAYDSLLGMYVGGGIFWSIAWVYTFFTKQDGLGGGDIKLMAMTGGILGYKSVIHSIFNGTALGAVVALFMIIFAGGGRKTQIPFGPWLSLGTILYLCKINLFDHYLQLLLR